MATTGQSDALAPRRVGRYAILDVFASGGMATIHFGRQLGEAGFARVVAIKRLHKHLASDPDFAAMFLDEAKMAARIRHPNVASTLDVVADGQELLIVMDYIAGAPLSVFIAARQNVATPIPPAIASAIVGDALVGLHAAHEAKSEAGDPLGLVHRDVSPQNLLVGIDGVTRVIDFGVAKAAGRLQVTQENCVKGKIAYMAPEQLRAQQVTRRSDVYSASVVLWECLTGRRLLSADGSAATEQVLLGDFDPPSRWLRELPNAVDEVVMKGLSRDAESRFATAREMAEALACVLPRASSLEVSAWLERQTIHTFTKHAARIADIERIPTADLAKDDLPARITPSASGVRSMPDAVAAGPSVGPSRSRWRPALSLALGAAMLTTTVVAVAIRSAPSPLTAHATLDAIALPDAAPSSVQPTLVTPVNSAAAPTVTSARQVNGTRVVVPRPSCRVPYVLGDDGLKHYKPECLQ